MGALVGQFSSLLFGNALYHFVGTQSKKHDKSSSATSTSGCGGSGGGGPGVQDSKKTCNLESYLEWTARLRLLVANEVLRVSEMGKMEWGWNRFILGGLWVV